MCHIAAKGRGKEYTADGELTVRYAARMVLSSLSLRPPLDTAHLPADQISKAELAAAVGGLRHIVWDKHSIGLQADKSSLLDIPKVDLSSKIIIGTSIVGTLGLAFLSL